MDKFENTINLIRDKLRTEGITGMDSINHCLAFIILRYLTVNKCKELGIPEEYAFENFMGDLKEDDQRLLEKFYFKSEKKGLQECLIKRLKTNGKIDFTQLNFKMKSPIYFSQILNSLNNIDLENLSFDYDIVGLVYELHLKTKSTGSGMRDLGQFFTNRQVIKYMVKLCDPKMNKNGDIEKILDPSMGTGGFLTMSIKHLNEKYKNKVDWDKNKSRIFGFDIDENVRNFALLNTLLECEKDFSKTLVQNDSLKNDYLIDKENNTIIDKVDVILANEPFGLKNIIHADCCTRINNLKIRGTKAEPLFLQLMMLSLNKGGRCAVIVPDGVLFNDTNLHCGTRNYLCKNFNLKKVISLEDGLFLNTGVKSSILFFVNDEETKEVEFCKIKMSNSEIFEESIIKVDIKEIEKNDYSLFVNKYSIPEEEYIIGIEYKKFGDICEFLPKSKRQASFGKNTGMYPFYTSSKDLTKYCDEIDYTDTCLIIGTGGNANIKISNNFSCSADNFVVKIKDKQILNHYLYYWFINNMTKLEECFHGSTIKHLSKGDLENIKIPIPHLSSQKLIIEKLDKITHTIKNLTASLKEESDKLQNNKIIDMVLKSATKDKEIIIDSESEDDDKKPEPKQKTNKKTKNITM